MDGLRAIAVILVCLAHVCQTAGFPSTAGLQRASHAGAVGVDVFFVLSGFLITTLLCRERERFGRVSLRDFYIRRVFRIVPAYCCFLMAVACLTIAGYAAPSVWDWVAAATYTTNFVHHPAWEVGHTWSLSIEEHFYLLWPLVFIILSERTAVAALVGVLAAGPLIRWTILLRWPASSPMIDLWTFTRLDTISAGCLLALVCRRPARLQQIDWLARRWPLFLAGLAAGLVGGATSGKFGGGVTPTINALTIPVLVWAAARNPSRWLEHPAVVALGIGSYSLYLWQQLFLNPHSAQWWTRFPQNLIFAGLCAAASWHLIEHPMLRVKDGFRPRIAGEERPDSERGPATTSEEAGQTLVAREEGRIEASIAPDPSRA